MSPESSARPPRLERIIWHWTGGAEGVTDDDRQHYHAIIDAAGRVHKGIHAPEANINTADGAYAAHTRLANTGSIGIAIDAMAGALEMNPFGTTKNPPTRAQIAALCRLTAELCVQYGIPVSPTTTLNHGEVQKNLGKPQLGKWDICVLPWSTAPHESVGDYLRAETARIVAEIRGAFRKTEAIKENAEPLNAAAEEEGMDINKAVERTRAAKAAYEEALAAVANAAEDVSLADAARNVVHQAKTGIDLEPGSNTSEMILAKRCIAGMIGGAALFGVVLPPEKIDGMLKLVEPVVAFMAVVIPFIFGMRTHRKNVNDKANAEIAKAA